jgi:hypothetical protein
MFSEPLTINLQSRLLVHHKLYEEPGMIRLFSQSNWALGPTFFTKLID